MHEISTCVSILVFCERLKYRAQLSLAWKKFIISGPDYIGTYLTDLMPALTIYLILLHAHTKDTDPSVHHLPSVENIGIFH